MGNYSIRSELLTYAERGLLSQLDVSLGPSEIRFGRRLAFVDMCAVGQLLVELYNRTPERGENHINFALGDWINSADEWFGENVGVEVARKMLPAEVVRAISQPSSPKDLSIKRKVIAAYFDDFQQRVRFVGDLIAAGRETEGIILCCVYIEGLGNNVHPECTDSMRNFVRIIRDHGEADLLTWVHPGWLLSALPQRTMVARTTVERLRSVPPTALLAEEEFLALVAPRLTDEQLEWLNGEVWRGTLAGLVYGRMRSPAVKQGLASNLILGESTHKGEPVGLLNVSLLYGVLQRILAAIRRISIESVKWFGTDGVV